MQGVRKRVERKKKKTFEHFGKMKEAGYLFFFFLIENKRS
jgi:hypothetical protein